MGTLTCANFITYLTLELGNRSDITTYDDAWINAGYYWLTARRDLYFPELDYKSTDKTTTDGTAYVDTASTMLYVQGVYDATNLRKLRKIKPRDYFKYPDRADTDLEGEPTEWTHVAGGTNRGYIYLHPTPDDEYTLNILHRALPSALTGTNATVIGTEWDEVVLRAAVWLGKMKLQYKADEIEHEKATLERMINDLKGLYDAENLDIDDGVKPKYAYSLSNK